MNRVQSHRGPDDEGYFYIDTKLGLEGAAYISAGGPDTPDALELPSYESIQSSDYDLVLASRRLAILDLTPSGHMPMSYANGAFWLTYNGEIYNYKELRIKLGKLGHVFQSDSDTEVLLAAYREWGVDCLHRLNGMFGFALWDTEKRHLFLARDRFGIKPLYYFWNGTTFAFASEIKALLQHPTIERRPNDQAIFDYLTLGLTDHSHETFFDEITSLLPGHFMLFSGVENSDGRTNLRVERWWQAEINPSLETHPASQQAIVYQNFAEILEDAIRLRLRSDVPIGSCLSGGLDSSAVVTLANQLLTEESVVAPELMGQHQKTFTARNRERGIDEYEYSNLIVKRTGAEEHLIYPEPTMLWEELNHFVWQLDEPVNSTSQYAQWNVMQLASQHGVTVLLDGQGGDEILAGYPSYYPAYLNQIATQLGWGAASKAGFDLARVGGRPVVNLLWEQAKHRMPWQMQRVIDMINPPRLDNGLGGSGLQQWQLERSFTEKFWARRWQPNGNGNLSASNFNGNDNDNNSGLVGLLYQDLTASNLPKLLRYEDRNSMSFSLETRLPFLDYRLVEMVFSLPINYRINNGWSKWILRKSMDKLLPPEITWRRTKLGFPTPEYEWLRTGKETIRQLMSEHAAKDGLSRYVRAAELKAMGDTLTDEEVILSPGLWRMVNLAVWMDLFLER